jgi:hypothetical protein
MPACSTSKPKPSRPRRKKTPPTGLAEEIERIQTFLRHLDGIVAEKDDVSLKDLAHAVGMACVGGKSIAWLRKFEQGLEQAVKDEDYDQLRARLFEMLETMGQRFQEGQAALPGLDADPPK